MISIAIALLLGPTRLAADVMPRAVPPRTGIIRMAEVPGYRRIDPIATTPNRGDDHDPSIYSSDEQTGKVIKPGTPRYQRMIKKWGLAVPK